MSTIEMEERTAPALDFVWMELTNRCNLRCVHCYAESTPYSGKQDLLTEEDYIRLIREVRSLGSQNLQFIGGEPTLNQSLPRLIQEAANCKFAFIEVFTNLIQLPEALLNTFVEYNVAVATSFYSHNPSIHDAITTHIGSFDRTVANMRRVLHAGLKLRAGIIVMDQNQEGVAETWKFLEELGVKNIGMDHLRRFGRGSETDVCDMGELCGSCAGNILSIGPDGLVAPCNMSKNWAVGSVLTNNLHEIVGSPELAEIRQKIGNSVKEREKVVPQGICTPKTCGPYSSCCPSTQSCNPCAPNGCSPCYPKG